MTVLKKTQVVRCSTWLYSPSMRPQCKFWSQCFWYSPERLYITSTAFSSLSLMLSSPLTSAFSLSRFSINACSSASSFSVTAFGSIFTMQLPPDPSMLDRMSTIAASSVWIPTAFSRHVLVRTYSGGETSLTFTWLSGVFRASAVRSAVLTASIPSYPKHVTSTSARTFVGWGVSRFPM